METVLGMIYGISESDKGYHTLVIKVNQAYSVNFKKFNVWDMEKYRTEFGDNFKEGAYVKISYYMVGNFPRLNSLELTPVSRCFECDAFTPERNNQQTECEMCYGLVPKDRVFGIHTLVTQQMKQYRYSAGVSLGFLRDNEAEGKKLNLTTVYENNPIFKQLTELKVGAKMDVEGWVTKENDDGSRFFSLSNTPDVI